MDKTERTSSRTKKTPSKSPSKKSSNNTSKNNGTKSNITSEGSSKDSINNGDNSDGEMVIEDENTWECSVCTYRNSQETFKCLMCDVCKGTSTRKPRYNHDLVAQKVKKQQIQIHQKLLKSSKHQQFTASSDTRDSSDCNSKDNTEKITETRDSKSKDHKEGKISSKESIDDQLIERKGHLHGKESKIKDEIKEGKETRVKGVGKGSGGNKTSKQSSDNTEEAGPSVNFNQHSQHESTINHNNKSNHNCSSSSASSPNHNGSSSSHLSPNINNNSSKITKSRENLVKSNSKSSIMRMKNIDRNNFLAQAVTVNNVTVIITEFQPKKKLKTTPVTKKPN